MAMENYTRVYWLANSQEWAILTGVAATDVFTISGDWTREFIDGTPFEVDGTASNNGAYYTRQDATYDSENDITTIYCDTAVHVVVDQGASGVIAQPQCFVEFDWLAWRPRYNNPAPVDGDRYGLPHRFQPPDSTKKQRFCISGVLAVDPLDIDKRATTGNTWYEEMYNLAALDDMEFYIFVLETNIRDNAEYTVKRVFRGYISDLETLLGTLTDDGNPPPADIPFTIVEDGTFTDLGDCLDPANLSMRTRP